LTERSSLACQNCTRTPPNAPKGNLQITPAFAWKEEEGRFIAARLLEGKVPQSPLRLRLARSSIAAGFLKCIEQYRPHSISRRGQPTPHWPDEAALVVVAVIQIFGFDALRLNAADERILRLDNNGRKSTYSSYLATLDKLGRVINAILRDWSKQIEVEKNIVRRRQLISFVAQAFHSFVVN
jgi:hypothetical protein